MALREFAKLAMLVAFLWINRSSAAQSQMQASVQRGAGARCPAVAGIGFVYIPAGSFEMGLKGPTDQLLNDSDQRPAHMQRTEAFCIARTALSAVQIANLARTYPQLVLRVSDFDTTPEGLSFSLQLLGFGSGYEEKYEIQNFQEEQGLPQTGIWDTATVAAIDAKISRKIQNLEPKMPWPYAVDLAAQLSRQTGRQFRLPNEVEWERAARGGLVRKSSPWGNLGEKFARMPVSAIHAQLSAVVCRYARKNSAAAKARAEYQSPANGFGVAGLMKDWEWTRSRYADYPYDPKDGREAMSARLGPRALRGRTAGQEDCPGPRVAVTNRDYDEVREENAVRLVVTPSQ